MCVVAAGLLVSWWRMPSEESEAEARMDRRDFTYLSRDIQSADLIIRKGWKLRNGQRLEEKFQASIEIDKLRPLLAQICCAENVYVPKMKGLTLARLRVSRGGSEHTYVLWARGPCLAVETEDGYVYFQCSSECRSRVLALVREYVDVWIPTE